MMDVLIPENRLRVDDALLARLKMKMPEVNWRDLEQDCREAYARYVALLDPDLRQRFGIKTMSESTAFYNAYFWILVFAKRFQSRHGPDAGVEQECFKILERPPADVDWKVVEGVGKSAEQV